MHERQHIGVHGRIEVTRGGRFEWTKPAGGCVVHENIEPAKRIADKTEHLFDVFFLTHIRTHAGGTPAECGNLLGNLFGFFSTRHIVNYHIRARFGQPQGTRLADATTRACNQGHFSLQINHRSTHSGVFFLKLKYCTQNRSGSIRQRVVDFRPFAAKSTFGN